MFRATLRIIIYPWLAYTFFIYFHAKYNDPNGFQGLSKALYINELVDLFSPEPVQEEEETSDENEEVDLSQFNDLDDFDQTRLDKEINSFAPQPLFEDLKSLEKQLYNIAIMCNLMQSELKQFRGFCTRPSLGCFAQIPYHHQVINKEMFEYVKPLRSKIEQDLHSAAEAFPDFDFLGRLDKLNAEIESFLDICGPNCLPLAKFIYDPSNLKEAENDKYKIKYEKAASEITEALISKLFTMKSKFKRQFISRPLIKDEFKGHLKASTEIAMILQKSSEHELVNPLTEKLKSIDEKTFFSLLTHQ